MNATIVSALARHILTAVAGGFMVKYNVDGATMDIIIGGLSALVGVGWSVFDKKTAKQ